MTLPTPILAYFVADRRNDGAALVDAFAPDAVVRDEGQSHVGREAIHAWWRAAKARYRHVVEPLEAGEKGDVVEVLGKVTGQFPGSPAMMTFAFRVKSDRIAGLEITA